MAGIQPAFQKEEDEDKERMQLLQRAAEMLWIAYKAKHLVSVLTVTANFRLRLIARCRSRQRQQDVLCGRRHWHKRLRRG
jgi:hypothetical protein